MAHSDLIHNIRQILVGRMKVYKIIITHFRIAVFFHAEISISNPQFGADCELTQRIFFLQPLKTFYGFCITALKVVLMPSLIKSFGIVFRQLIAFPKSASRKYEHYDRCKKEFFQRQAPPLYDYKK